MGYLLHVRGRLALHASVVGWRGAAYVFAGAAGAGKSTTVGALVGRGCTAVSDDIAALSRTADGWEVHGGVPGVRLTPAAQAALGVGPDATTPVWDGSPFAADKAVARCAPGRDDGAAQVDSGGALPLACVFLLPARFAAGAGDPRVAAVPPVAAVPALAAHLLTPAWLPRSMDGDRFRAVADLVRETPVRTVERPDDLAAVPALCDAVLEEMDRPRP